MRCANCPNVFKPYRRQKFCSLKCKNIYRYRQTRDILLEKARQRDKARKGTKTEKERSIKTTYNMIKKYPERYKARYLLRNAVAQGLIKKDNCEVCNIPRTEGHHNDYSKPLEARWLCIPHHKELHNRIREEQFHNRFAKFGVEK